MMKTTRTKTIGTMKIGMMRIGTRTKTTNELELLADLFLAASESFV